MLISPAWAQGSGGFGLEGLGGFLPIILIFVVFYFLLIRPQQKKAKDHRQMIADLRRGDRVVTNGGLIGTIIRVPNESELILEIAEDVKVRVMRGMIAESRAKGRPALSKRSRPEPEPEDYDEDYDEEEGYEEEEEEEKTSSGRSGKK